MSFHKHLLNIEASVNQALKRLNELASDAIIFLTNEQGVLQGALTDGDIRRGLINGLGTSDPLSSFAQPNPKFIMKDKFDLKVMKSWRANNYKIIPITDKSMKIVDVINFRKQRSYLPIDAVIMAGGKGVRLRPLTLDKPKPLLEIGGKPIVEYNVDRLKEYGIKNQTFTINYLGEQIEQYFGDGSERDLNICYVREDVPLGTIGALSMVKSFYNDYILVMNSDILTNINFEDMFEKLLNSEGDMIVATSPYEVDIPYGVIETQGDLIIDLKEKPTYTYYSNAGIYMFKKEYVNSIPQKSHFNATDLMEHLYDSGKRVINYPILDYWLDIGKPHDFEKAQRDVAQITF